jgi:hypothetical protein
MGFTIPFCTALLNYCKVNLEKNEMVIFLHSNTNCKFTFIMEHASDLDKKTIQLDNQF